MTKKSEAEIVVDALATFTGAFAMMQGSNQAVTLVVIRHLLRSLSADQKAALASDLREASGPFDQTQFEGSTASNPQAAEIADEVRQDFSRHILDMLRDEGL